MTNLCGSEHGSSGRRAGRFRTSLPDFTVPGNKAAYAAPSVSGSPDSGQNQQTFKV